MKRGTAVVVGGGVSGLTLSFKLLKNQKFNRVVLLEKKNKIGGWLETKQFSGIGLFEQGPRSVRVSGGEETLKLLKEIELNPLLPTLQSKARFILTPNRSGDSSEIRELFPSSKLEFFSKSPMAPLLPDIIKNQFLVRNKQFTGRETIYEFFSAQFGERLARTIGAAAIGGIYAGDIEKLSTRDCFPIFFDTMEAGKSSSLLLASLKKAFSGKKTNETKMDEKIKSAGAYSFTKGMQQLPNEIRSVLETNFSDQFHLMQNQTILQIEKNEKSNVSTAYLSDSSKIEFDHLFFTTPSFETGTILRNFTGNEHNENISRTIQLLESIHYADIAVINMAWNSSLNTPQGFGYLVSPTTCASILGVTFDSVSFPTHNHLPGVTRMTAMLGGDTDKGRSLPLDDIPALEKIAISSVLDHLKISNPPDFIHTAIHKQAIPQYYVNHFKKVKELEHLQKTGNNNFTILGTGLYGVSINNCIKKANNIAENFDYEKN